MPGPQSARVLTGTVVDLQRRTVERIGNVADELRQIRVVLQELTQLIKEHLQK